MSNPEAVLESIRREDVAALARAIDASPVARALGIELTMAEAGRAEARLKPSAALENFLGYTHTGALFALAEQAMAAAANSLGHVGLPLSCEVHLLKGGDPAAETVARARVIDTQGRVARVLVEITQGSTEIVRLTEMVFFRAAGAG